MSDDKLSRPTGSEKLRSYRVAHRELIPEAIRNTSYYENNRAVSLRAISVRLWPLHN
nr:hypothetical protein [Candidatus Litorirhabdus singularis]